MDNGWNPWKLTTIGLALVMATAVVTGLVVANWPGSSSQEDAPASPSARPTAPTKTTTRSLQAAQAPLPAVPTREAIAACNRYAASQAGEQDRTKEVVKDAAIGAVVGAAVGAVGGAVADGGTGAGKGAAIGGILGAGGGTLYGLNENKQHDEKYQAAYGSCMRSRGYTG